jgi:hypothetical protein
VAPVGSIPTRSRHRCFRRPVSSFSGNRRFVSLRRGALVVCVALLLGVCSSVGLAAQDSASVAPAAEPPAIDSLRKAPSPMNAFIRSFLLPGWGQAKLDRKLTAGLLVAWEGVTLGMSLKTRHELAYLRRTGSGRAEDKRREHEDWLVLLGFNHLFAGLEAYVSAHLSDFPRDLKFRAVPGGGFGASYAIPFQLR